MREVFIPVLVVFVLLPVCVNAQDYYVDKDSIGGTCSDSNPGTITQPWCTIGKANAFLQAGDTVYIRAGTFQETINPSNSGTEGKYITYQNYQSDIAILQDVSYGIYFLNVNYIKVDGIKLDGEQLYPNADMSKWVRFENANYCIVQNVTMEYCNGWSGIEIRKDCEYNKLLDNIIKWCGQPADSGEQGNSLTLRGNRNLIEGNEFYYAGHNLLEIMDGDSPYSNGKYNVIRNNIFDNGEEWGRCVQLRFDSDGIGTGNQRNVFENNIVRRSHRLNGGEPNSGMEIISRDNIIRFNEFYDNYGYGCHLAHMDQNQASWNKIYGNVFYNNGKRHETKKRWGFCISDWVSDGTKPEDNCIKNNILYDNGQENIRFDDCSEGDHIVSNNHRTGDPKFVDAENYNFYLQSGSPCIDNGTWLTTATSSGSGTQIQVDDAGYFMDGFGIVDGDVIQLEGQNQTARITNVDYNNNIITVNKNLIWANGDGVSLAYGGPAPDIGAYEYSEEVCGDGTCGFGETCFSCSEDCGCVLPEICCDGLCTTPACFNESDCGTDTFCRFYTCNNPGNCSASCSYTNVANNTECTGGICCSGECVAPVCSLDSDCDDGDACTTDTCNYGGTCAATCSHESVTECINDDDCCPPGCTNQNDNDCPPGMYETQDSEDTLLSSGYPPYDYPDYNYGGMTTYYIGSRQQNESDRVLLKFLGLISSDNVPVGSNITSADIILTHTGSQVVSSPIDLKVRRVLESWTEGNKSSAQADPGETTWNHRSYDTQRWSSDTEGDGGTNAGCSSPESHTTSNEASKSYTTNPSEGEQVSLNVTSIVQYWATNGGSSNQGFILIAPGQEGGSSQNFIRFASSEHSTPDYRPKIIVSFTSGEAIPGDLNYDGSVDVLDLGIIAANFGKTSGFEPRADVVDNNEIDVFDLVFVASRFT
jgi:hypothetical protein